MDIPSNKEMDISSALAVLKAFDNTDVCIFMYYPQTKSIIVPKKTCLAYQCKPFYDDMPRSFAKEVVHPDDYAVFYEMYYKIDSGFETATSKFHSKDLNYCWKVTLTTLSWGEKEKPEEVFGIIENITDIYKSNLLIKKITNEMNLNNQEEIDTQEATSLIASSISSLYSALYHIWLNDFSYICFQEQSLSYIAATGKKKPCDKENLKKYIKEYVEPDYQKDMFEFLDYSTLADRLHNTDSITFIYKRKDTGWTKGQFIVAKRDADGNVTNVIFIISNINEEREREKNQQQAVYESQHDPLTGSYNRKGYEMIVSSQNMLPAKIGIAAIDIDNFKTLNDSYGHDFGDQVLVAVAEQLETVFRKEDKVFRMGGDEFTILFPNCDENVWNNICHKLKTIHTELADTFSSNTNASITLSVGVYFSDNGYNDTLPGIADKALYETKQNGRAGCTLIDQNMNIKKQWRDESLSLHSQSVLEYNSTGLFRMEIPADKQKKPRIICGETTKLILGISNDATPEECYEVWKNGIENSYLEPLLEVKGVMLKGEQAEYTYLWNHSKWGKIFVRSGGYGEKKDDMDVLHGFHHALKDTTIIERKDDKELLISALTGIYFCSYYINLESDTYATFKIAPGEDHLQMQNKKASEILKEFISVLVAPNDREKMSEFMNLDTLPERMKNEKYLDCEYRSQALKGWCRARLIPIKYNKQKELTHILFVIAALDSTKAKELDVTDYNKKSLTALFNNVPGGIVMYEWDGKQLKTLHISEYYTDQYGNTLVSDVVDNKGIPDYKKIHPDDIDDYQKEFLKTLNETHTLHYEFRIWNTELKHYVWVRIDATSDPQSDGTSLVYAIYTDITELKDAQQSLEKSRMSLASALSASNQLSYEYDPATHTGVCFTDENFFNLPQYIENYPDSLRDIDLFHPDDADTFISTAHQMDNGAKKAQCDVRIKKNGEYCWYSCMFDSYYDHEKEHNVAILTVVDISLRIASMRNYEERLRSILVANAEALSMITINLTKNTFSPISVDQKLGYFLNDKSSFEEQFLKVAGSIVGKSDQDKFTKLFNRNNLLKMAKEGKTHVQMKYLFKFNDLHYEWITAAVDMIQNPVTGEITGVSYCKSSQFSQMSNFLLEKTLQQDYLFASIIFKDTDEFYVYKSSNGRFSDCMQNFWDIALMELNLKCSETTRKQLQSIFVKDKIIQHIEKESEFSYAYNSVYNGENCRLEMKFSYIDDRHTMILASLRNITDDMLLEKLRHDSEHDLLTDLYNRRTVFKKSERLLKEHPQDQFVMAHIDIKHFHLYNTFFGDKAGDELLCHFADFFRQIDKDFDYWAYGHIESDVFCAFIPFDQERYDNHIKDVFERLKNYQDDFLIEPAIGLYYVTDKNMPMESMFTRATIASKYVKSGINNATVIYNDEMERKIKEEHQVINEMQMAIEQEQFKIYLQPKYSLRTGKPIGAEALVRWVHPKKGIVPPAKFIPIFESNGFIAELDRYMWEHVCMLLRRWIDDGKMLTPVSVNVSRISMFSPATVHFLKELIKKYNIDPEYLELELTESAYIDDPDELKVQMKALRKAGFKILMDDFGSGYSSLNTLKNLPVDILKLDMKFLSSTDNNLRGSTVLSSIVRMSKLLDLTIIAEGVEKEEQAEFLRSIGCEYVQGYLYSKPMSVSEYEEDILDYTVPVEYKEKNNLKRITNLLNDSESDSVIFGEMFAVPMAILEYLDGTFAYLRANKYFLSEFELTEDLKPASKVFRNHLPDEEYTRLIKAYSKCAKTKQSVCFTLNWIDSNSEKQKYFGRVIYQGKIGTANVLAVLFNNAEDINFIE